MIKTYFKPQTDSNNEQLFQFLEGMQLNFQEDEKKWDGEHLDFEKEISVDELPTTVKFNIMEKFYQGIVTDDQFEMEVSLVQHMTLQMKEQEKQYFLYNAGYYACMKKGRKVTGDFKFFPTQDSVKWAKHITKELEKAGWIVVAIGR